MRNLRNVRKVSSVFVEGLEDRRLFAVTAVLSGGVVTVTGDSLANTVSITETTSQITVAVAGVKKNIVFSGSPKRIEVNMGGGDDNLTITETAATLLNNGGNTILTRVWGGTGIDTINVTKDGGTAIILGGDGNDDLTLNNGNSAYSEGDQVSGDAGNDTIHTFGFVYTFIGGGAGDDTITDGAGQGDIYGGIGNDILIGGDGPDRLYGEDGNDTITGGNGDDWIAVSNGVDTLNAGAGNDTIFQMDATVSAWSSIDGGDGDDVFYYSPYADPSGALGHTFSNIEITGPNPYQ
jgi:Ca2+-binding RTX toxin-like protein